MNTEHKVQSHHQHTDTPRIVHAENPDSPGDSICGTPISSRHSSAEAIRCAVCEDMTRPSFTDR